MHIIDIILDKAMPSPSKPESQKTPESPGKRL